MLRTGRQWQVHLWVSTSRSRDYIAKAHPVCLYGETVADLKEQVRDYLTQHRPSYFANTGDHIAGYFYYVYLDGVNPPPHGWVEEDVFSEEDFKKQKGWWFHARRFEAGRSRVHPSFLIPFFLGSLQEGIEHFLQTAFIPRKGPDYRSWAIMEEQPHLSLLESVLHEAEEFTLNDLLQRGWQILAVEYQGEVSKTGELTNRKASFVLGHTDPDAASYTMERRHEYYYRLYHWPPDR